MSYDFGYKCQCCQRWIETRNLTHNVNQMITECLKAAGVPKKDGQGSWSMVDGRKAVELLPVFQRALEEAMNPDRRVEFDVMMPDNGFGTKQDVIEAFLWAITATTDVMQNHGECGVWRSNG